MVDAGNKHPNDLFINQDLDDLFAMLNSP